MKWIYFEKDEMDGFAEWLKGHPNGKCRVLIGIDELHEQVNVISDVMWHAARDRGLAQWIAEKIEKGELQIKGSRKISGIPHGKEFDENT